MTIAYPVRISDPSLLQKLRELVDAANQANQDMAEFREDIAAIDGGAP